MDKQNSENSEESSEFVVSMSQRSKSMGGGMEQRHSDTNIAAGGGEQQRMPTNKRDWHFLSLFHRRTSPTHKASTTTSRDSGVDETGGETCGSNRPTDNTRTARMARLRIPKLTIREASLDAEPLNNNNTADRPFSSYGWSSSLFGQTAATSWTPDSTLDNEMKTSSNDVTNIGQSGATTKFPLWKLKIKPGGGTAQSSQSSSDSAWKSSDSNSNLVWRSVDGGELTLKGSRLEYLTSLERNALQKIAVQKLQKANLNTSIQKPKEGIEFKTKRQKLRGIRANTVTVVDKHTRTTTGQQVFGIPIQQCIENDQRAQQLDAESRARSLDETLVVDVAAAVASGQPQTSTNTGSLLSVPKWSLAPRLSTGSARSVASGSETSVSPRLSPRSPIKQMFRSSRESSTSESNTSNVDPMPQPASPQGQKNSASTRVPPAENEGRNPQVPRIVETCTDYLKKHGMNTVGLFRVAGNARRCRQLRVELDSGQEVIITDGMDDGLDVQPHDVAALLKEYFRDLPHPLMTKEMFPVCVAIGKATHLTEEQMVDLLRCVIALLPSANSDTLLVLLRFLAEVAVCADDQTDQTGQLLPGNRMNAANLATVFAPSVLRSSSKQPPTSTSVIDVANDNDAIVRVCEFMITHSDELFTIPRELQSQMYQMLKESEPDALDNLLYRLHNQFLMNDDGGGAAQPHGSVYCETSQEECGEPEVSKDVDGTTIVKYRSEVTHRIVYRPSQKRFDISDIVSSCQAAADATSARLHHSSVGSAEQAGIVGTDIVGTGVRQCGSENDVVLRSFAEQDVDWLTSGKPTKRLTNQRTTSSSDDSTTPATVVPPNRVTATSVGDLNRHEERERELIGAQPQTQETNETRTRRRRLLNTIGGVFTKPFTKTTSPTGSSS